MQLFRKTKELEGKISTFLMNITQAGFLFTQALDRYFSDGVSPEFLDLRAKVSALEAENDSLRRDVENQLYANMLLPDMRSDILTLIDKAQADFDEEKAKEMTRKMKKAEFDFNDLLDQFQQMKKMGGVNQIMSMLPGVGSQLKDVELDDDMFYVFLVESH